MPKSNPYRVPGLRRRSLTGIFFLELILPKDVQGKITRPDIGGNSRPHLYAFVA